MDLYVELAAELAQPTLTSPLAVGGNVEQQLEHPNPNCNDLCPVELHCPNPKPSMCPRYNDCKPHLSVDTVGRLLASARRVYLNEGSPYLGPYLGPFLVPENDPNLLLSWYALQLLEPTAENDRLLFTEINKIFPGLKPVNNEVMPAAMPYG